MATEYTAGILNGSINTFNEFALKCSQAFLIQFREGAKEYTPRTPSAYYQKKMDKIREKVSELNQTTDNELKIIEIALLEEIINSSKESIIKIEKEREKLKSLLKDSINYEAPTDKHKEIKKFMTEQLEKTLNFHETDYLEDLIKETNIKLANIDTFSIRAEKLNNLNQSYKHALESYEKDVKACNSSNKWYNEFVKSLK